MQKFRIISMPQSRLTLALLGSLILASGIRAAEPPKKAAPAPAAAKPAAAPAAHPAGATTGTVHGPTTSAPGTHETTGNHGPTTSSGSGPITTNSRKPAGPQPGKETASAGKPAQSQPSSSNKAPSAFHNPAPAGTKEVHASNGAAVRTRADGTRADIHDPKRGMDIHHGLSGNRRVVVERPDHSRVVAERGGRGYVQHPYSFHGQEFGHRTYYEHGRAYDRFYGRYPYRGGYLNVYAPARFYPVGFYGYAYSPWPAPVSYGWGWGGAPWYGYYGAYYAPYPVYPAPNYWLADFVIAASLAAAFEVVAASADLDSVPSASPLLSVSQWFADRLVEPAAADALSATPMSADVKQAVAEEIKALVQREADQSKANAAQKDIDPSQNSITQLLSDKQPHVLVAGTDVDLTSGSGQECALSQGDVLKIPGPLSDGAETLNAIVMASKGGKECAMASTVSVAVSDLQDMENHMREQVDDGMGELQKKQGKGGIPAAPPGAGDAPVAAGFAADAPPPDPTAKNEIAQQAKAADQAETEVIASVAASPADDVAASGPVAIGQSIDVVTAKLGTPVKIIDLGAKKIYTYPDQKIIFSNGQVEKIE